LRGKGNTLKILPIFLLGNKPETLSGNKAKQDLQTNETLERYRLSRESKFLIRSDKDLLKINIKDADGFVIFPYSLQRFAPLIYLAEIKKPVVIVIEENTFLQALETYDYLSDHQNVQLAFSPKELKARIRTMGTEKWLENYKVCLFDAGNWTLDGAAWHKNPLITGRLNVQSVNVDKFLEACRNADRAKAERLAKKWMKESKVLEPSLEDVVKVAQTYLAMKATMKEMRAKVAYVLWCGQFTKQISKMCFALAKLADDGYPVGCWRGGNALAMLLLHSVSSKPVFTPEAFKHRGKTISLKHCFAPSIIGPCMYTLRNWRTTKGTVTGYCQLPKGEVTLINCGIGNEIVVTKGRVVDCKDIGGENCRITVWVEIEKEEIIHKFVAREFAMVYGDYERQAKELAEKMGIRVL